MNEWNRICTEFDKKASIHFNKANLKVVIDRKVKF